MSLAPANTQPLILRRHPFDQDPGVFPVRGGQTLGAMLREGAQGAQLSDMLVVSINGHEVPRAMWDRVRPKEGTAIHVTGTVAGGGNNGLRIVLMIVVMVVAFWTGQWYAINGAAAWGMSAATIGNMITAGIMVVGQMAVNALVPPPKPTSPSGTEGRWNMLTGNQNNINPYGAIPFVLGEARFFPPHAAMPYTVSVGQDSYQYCLFDLGYLTAGAVVEDIRIGNTPLANFQGVDYQVSTSPTIYSSDVSELAVSAGMEINDVVDRTTAQDVDEVVVDIIFPQGLFGIGTNGKDFSLRSYWNIQYRPIGSGVWINLPTNKRLAGFQTNMTLEGPYVVQGIKKKPFAVGIAFNVPAGQYEVRVTRLSVPQGNEDNTYVYDAVWASLRSIRKVNPSTTGTTKLAMRIKANDQLNGTLQSLSLMVKQKIPVWDRDTDTWSDQLTCNTAWVTHWLLRHCPGVHKRAPAEKVNLDQWADYAAFCETHSLQTRRVVDNRLVMRDLLDDVLSGSLGRRSETNGKYGVVFDHGSSVPSMVFTELESGDLSAVRAFHRIPHAIRTRFINPLINWRTDEIIVVDDGYSYRGQDARGNPSAAPAPTDFEVLDLQIACYPEQAWRLARYHLAQAKFRPTTYMWQADISALGVIRGDVVDVQSPVTEWGAGAGFVRSVEAGGPTGAATVRLYEQIETDPAKTYRAQIRRVDGTIVTEVYNVTPHSPITDTFYFATMPTLAEGDAVVIGETTRGAHRLLVTGLSSGDKLSFAMAGVAYDERVAPFWLNPPASFTSEVTGGQLEPPDPPVVDVIVSNPENGVRDDAGIDQPELHIGFREPSGVEYMLQ